MTKALSTPLDRFGINLIDRMHPMTLSPEQIAIRKPVWIALSELWLDTELDPADLERIAEEMRQSGLSLTELRMVYLCEVDPVVYQNALSLAGEWAGFDPEWLCREIRNGLERHSRRWRFKAWFPPTRYLMTYATERHWKVLEKLVKTTRGN